MAPGLRGILSCEFRIEQHIQFPRRADVQSIQQIVGGTPHPHHPQPTNPNYDIMIVSYVIIYIAQNIQKLQKLQTNIKLQKNTNCELWNVWKNTK